MPERQTFTRDRLSVRGLANWILDLADASQVPITNMALNKLVYFVIEKALVERNRLLTDAKIEAWEHGPVFREIYHQFKSYGDKPITSRAGFYSVETGNVEISKAELPEEIKGEIGEFIRPLIGLSAAKL